MRIPLMPTILPAVLLVMTACSPPGNQAPPLTPAEVEHLFGPFSWWRIRIPPQATKLTVSVGGQPRGVLGLAPGEGRIATVFIRQEVDQLTWKVLTEGRSASQTIPLRSGTGPGGSPDRSVILTSQVTGTWADLGVEFFSCQTGSGDGMERVSLSVGAD